MPGNLNNSQTKYEEVKFIPISDVIDLARNPPDQNRAKHVILHMLNFFTKLVENSHGEQQLLLDFIKEKGWN